ncbi:hypothetical protein EVAR_84100_1 [Eumeta japonica]|uniref:Uncharacterized protein n=1 Tax=Eumeta variegata TaxID=151549 RepID=A0A4C1V0T1_EUMVA|nr:hypothetical protein EVAR_84100_1 [Eumeta japonica]
MRKGLPTDIHLSFNCTLLSAPSPRLRVDRVLTTTIRGCGEDDSGHDMLHGLKIATVSDGGIEIEKQTESIIKNGTRTRVQSETGTEFEYADGVRIKSVTRIGLESEIEIQIDIDRYKRIKNSFYDHASEAAGIKNSQQSRPYECNTALSLDERLDLKSLSLTDWSYLRTNSAVRTVGSTSPIE